MGAGLSIVKRPSVLTLGADTATAACITVSHYSRTGEAESRGGVVLAEARGAVGANIEPTRADEAGSARTGLTVGDSWTGTVGRSEQEEYYKN